MTTPAAPPARIRVGTAVYTDWVVPACYDSLVAKLIAFGGDRTEAIGRLNRALDMFIVEGIHTSIPLHKRILADTDFQAGNFDTNFIKRFSAGPADATLREQPSLMETAFAHA